MKNLFKILSLCIIFIFIFILSSCEKEKEISWNKLTHTTYSEMLSKEHDYYYLLFYSPDCKFCEEVLPVAINYQKNNNAYPIYVINIDDLKNNSGLKASEGYQYFSFIGTSNYQDVILENVPAFIVVKNNVVDLLISSQTTDRPKSEIIHWLEN